MVNSPTFALYRFSMWGIQEHILSGWGDPTWLGGWFKHPSLNSENTAGKDPYPLPPTSQGEVKTVNLPNFALHRCFVGGEFIWQEDVLNTLNRILKTQQVRIHIHYSLGGGVKTVNQPDFASYRYSIWWSQYTYQVRWGAPTWQGIV